MRSSCRFRPRYRLPIHRAAAAAAGLWVLLLAPIDAPAQAITSVLPSFCACAPSDTLQDPPQPARAVPKVALDESDEIAALEAIRVALTRVGDGSTYVWYRENSELRGFVRPTASFKDRGGRVCRHIVVALSAGERVGRIEGIACRQDDGRWVLEG
jgi:hypothetical protein